MSDFRDIFKQLRKAADLTQDQLATALKMSRSAISMYERGEREPDFETLETIADYFNVDMNYLTGWTDDPTNYEDGDLLSSIPLSYMEACGNDPSRALQMQRAAEEDALAEMSSPTESRLKLLARHLEQIPEEKREKLIKNFEDNIDVYLDALGLSLEDE